MADVIVAASATEATIRTAIETTAGDGDTVVLTNPQNITIVTNPLRIINKAIKVISSTGNPRNCVINGINGQPIFDITNPASTANMRGLEISGMTLAGAGSTTFGIRWVGTAGQLGLKWARFANLIMTNVQTGISLIGGGSAVLGSGASSDGGFHPTVEYCDITAVGGVNTGRGIVMTNCIAPRINKNYINSFAQNGILLTSCPNARLTANSVEACNLTPLIKTQTQDSNSQVSLNLCNAFVVQGLDVSTLNASAVDGLVNPAFVATGLSLRGCIGGSIDVMTVGFVADFDLARRNSLAIAYLEGTRGVRRGTVLTSYLPDNPVLYDRFSPPSIQGETQPVVSLTRDPRALGLQTI